MLSRFRQLNHGIALVVVLLALLVLGTLAGGLVMVTSGHLMHAYGGNESQEALYAARAGAWVKLAQYRSAKNLNPIPETKLPGSSASYTATIKEGDPRAGLITKRQMNERGPREKTIDFPPPGTVYVEAVGKSSGGKTRKVGILATLSQSRWNHAAFGNTKVELKSGAYTDSFNSYGEQPDHSRASIATNNPKDGIIIGDHRSVVVGWANSSGDDGRKKMKKDKKSTPNNLEALASVQGPPGSTEAVVIGGDKESAKSYRGFQTGDSSSNQDPVVIPAIPTSTLTTDTLDGQGTITVLPDQPHPDLTVTGEVRLTPEQAFHYLKVQPGGKVYLDVTGYPDGATVQYLFTGITLNSSSLEVLQPPDGEVTVKVYVDTGDGSDPSAGVLMQGASVVNPSQRPINLQLLIAGKGVNKLEGHDDAKHGTTPKAYYVAYGPEADIEVFGGQIFGAVVGDKVTLDGDELNPEKAPAVIHYDTALLQDTENASTFVIHSVRYF